MLLISLPLSWFVSQTRTRFRIMCTYHILAILQHANAPSKNAMPGFSVQWLPAVCVQLSTVMLTSFMRCFLYVLSLFPSVQDRITAAEALNHPWLRGDTASSSPLDSLVLQGLKVFDASCTLKKIVLKVMSNRLNSDEIEALKVSTACFSMIMKGCLLKVSGDRVCLCTEVEISGLRVFDGLCAFEEGEEEDRA